VVRRRTTGEGHVIPVPVGVVEAGARPHGVPDMHWHMPGDIDKIDPVNNGLNRRALAITFDNDELDVIKEAK
jgi:hypothetical protein